MGVDSFDFSVYKRDNPFRSIEMLKRVVAEYMDSLTLCEVYGWPGFVPIFHPRGFSKISLPRIDPEDQIIDDNFLTEMVCEEIIERTSEKGWGTPYTVEAVESEYLSRFEKRSRAIVTYVEYIYGEEKLTCTGYGKAFSSKEADRLALVDAGRRIHGKGKILDIKIQKVR